MKTDLAGILSALRSARSVLVASHVNPDGDAVGSVLAMIELLQLLGIQADGALHDPVPRMYAWLPGATTILPPEQLGGTYDTVIVLDVSRRARIGRVAAALPAGARLLVLDHHLDDTPDGDLWFVDPSYAATGEIVAELYEVAGVPIPRDAALCAYVALATDTGGFRFGNTSPRAHRTAAALIECGLDVGALSARLFDLMPRPKFELLARLAGRTEFLMGGRLAHTAATLADLEACGANHEHTDNLINFCRYVEGVELALLFHEMEPAKVKVSLRGRAGVNCAELAARFGGGGHAAAAGAFLAMPLDEARAHVLAHATRFLEDLA